MLASKESLLNGFKNCEELSDEDFEFLLKNVEVVDITESDEDKNIISYVFELHGIYFRLEVYVDKNNCCVKLNNRKVIQVAPRPYMKTVWIDV